MFKKYLTIFIILFLTNCSVPGTAFLGPAVTGVTTKSSARASLSFGSNQIIKKTNQVIKKTNQIVKRFDNISSVRKNDDF